LKAQTLKTADSEPNEIKTGSCLSPRLRGEKSGFCFLRVSVSPW